MPKHHSTARVTLEHPRATLADVVSAIGDLGCVIADAGTVGDSREVTEMVIVDASRIGACVTLVRSPGSPWVGTWARLGGPVANDPITALFGHELTGAALFAVLAFCSRGDLTAVEAAAGELLTTRGLA